MKESVRIQSALDGLGPEFRECGIVKTTLRARIRQEKLREAKKENKHEKAKRLVD